jgi:hypothetical protein
MLVLFTAFCSILRRFGIFHGYFGTFLPFWYVVPRKIWQHWSWAGHSETEPSLQSSQLWLAQDSGPANDHRTDLLYLVRLDVAIMYGSLISGLCHGLNVQFFPGNHCPSADSYKSRGQFSKLHKHSSGTFKASSFAQDVKKCFNNWTTQLR